eukprot:6170321-Amphidinium_carterae.1
MGVSAAPDEEVASGFVMLDGPTPKRTKELATDSHKTEHRRHAIEGIEKDAQQSNRSGDDSRRRKIKKDDKSWRRDTQQKRTNGWDSEWGPSSSSCENSEEKYVPMTIKLKDTPEFMKPIDEEGIFDRRDMEPVKRTSKAWNMCTEDKAVNVGDYKPFRPPPPEARGPGYWTTNGDWVKIVENEDEQPTVAPVAPRPPPPHASGTGRWNSDGEWVEGGKKKRTTTPPPHTFLPTMSQKEKSAFLSMSIDDRKNYSQLMSIE